MSVGAAHGDALPSRGLARRAAEWLGALVPPTALSFFIVNDLWPSRLAGARGGLVGLLGWAGDRYPLFVGVGAFVVLAEAGRYWRRHVTASIGGARAPDELRTASGKRRLLIGLAVVAVAAFVMRSSVVAMYRVVGPSMLPTLEMGDRVLVDRRAYGVRLPFAKTVSATKTPRRGDLVVFSARGLLSGGGPASIVKRVIGIPGDRIAFDRGSIVVNDAPIPACDAGPYANVTGGLTVRGRLVVEFLDDATYLTVRKPLEAEFPTTTVKAGEVFVLGDDRGMSTDSRVWSEGHGTGVPVDALDGKVSRVLLGARPDGRLDFSRLFARPLGLEVRLPGIDLTTTQARIAKCLERHGAGALPDPTGRRR